MPSMKKNKRRKASKQAGEQVSFTLESGTKLQLTIEAGQEKDGKVPVTIQVEGLKAGRSKKPRARSIRLGGLAGSLKTVLEALASRLRRYDLATWLFIGAVVVYLATRLIGLTQFPIFFFTDEALQTQFMAELVEHGYRDAQGHLFPPAFRNGDYYTLGMGVYVQWLPYILFGKSAVVTRATSVLVTLIAAISVGVILRDVLKVKYWWTGTLFLSITPAWFLHSRTAWEVAEFVGFYAGALCAYLLYRIKSPRYLYLAIFLGALGFYTYSPGQVLVPVTALALLISDWRYHWENRGTALRALILLAILAIPYIRFRMMDPDNAVAHLHTLSSYLFEDIPLSEKIRHYFSEYFIGMGAWYWYTPNERELQRQIMKGYGNIMIATLPFALFGLAYVIRRVRESTHRTILIAMLAAPVAGAFAATGITRTMVFVFPASILTALGLEQVLLWLETPAKRLLELARGPGLTSPRIVAAVAIFILGCLFASLSELQPDRITACVLAAILALQVSGVFGWLARRIKQTRFVANLKKWNPSHALIALVVFAILSIANVSMLTDALVNGPTWYKDYGMGGMQYGAFQIFDIIKQYRREHPETKIMFSPSWANGTDVVARFFMNDPLPFEMQSINGFIIQPRPLDDNTLFIMLKEEYELALSSGKFADIRIEKTVPYPDGTPGFYFVRLRYADNADELFAAEKAFRAILPESTIKINGEDVHVRHTFLDAGDQQNLAIQHVFDNDPYTPAKTFEDNPFIIELTFPSPRRMSGFSIIVGSTKVTVTLKCYSAPGVQPVIYEFEGQGTVEKPELSFDLAEPITMQVLYLEMLDVYAGSPTMDHIWELKLH